MNNWISVSERLPENEQDVLICVKRKRHTNPNEYIMFVSRAFHTDGKYYTENSAYDWDDCDLEYDERLDSYVIPEGWWEVTDYIGTFTNVMDFVTHWMPLPEMPEDKP